MSQIEIKILKQGHTFKNVLTCAFFTMEDAYRSFEWYQRYLKKFLDQSKKIVGFELRIYTDDTGKDIVLKLVENDPDVSVYHFNCPQFREGKGHIGTFGTMARFLPFFEKGLDYVWSSDIDVPDFYLTMHDMKEVKDNKCDMRISTRICYERKVYGRNYTIIAGRLISGVQWPKVIFTKFLNKLADGGFEKEIKLLNDSNTRKKPSKIPYGIDEYFLNFNIYDWIKRNDFKVFVDRDLFLNSMLSYNTKISAEASAMLDRYYKNPEKKNIHAVKEVYKKYIPHILDKFPCTKEILDKLDSFKVLFEEKIVVKSSDI